MEGSERQRTRKQDGWQCFRSAKSRASKHGLCQSSGESFVRKTEEKANDKL